MFAAPGCWLKASCFFRADPETAKNLAENPFFKLEHETRDKQAAKKVVPAITQLLELRDEDWKDDAASSKVLRKRFREERKVLEKAEQDTQDLQKKSSLAIPLVKETEEDVARAKRTKFAAATPRETLMKKVAKHQMTSIFNDPKQPQTTSLLTKERLEKEKRTMELAAMKKKHGIDHKKFHLLETDLNGSPLQRRFPLRGLIRVKKSTEEESSSLAAPSVSSTVSATELLQNYDDSDGNEGEEEGEDGRSWEEEAERNTDDEDDDPSEGDSAHPPQQGNVASKVRSLVDY